LETALAVKRVPVDAVHPDPANVRLHDTRSLEAIKGSLARFGQQKPIVVDRQGTIRAGNGTYAAALALGWKEIQVVETDLEGIEAVAYAIADNRSSDLSEFDGPALAKLLAELRAEDMLADVGFSDEEFAELLADIPSDVPGFAQDETPALPEEAVTRKGDLWILGRHRLLCGDSAAKEDVDRLLSGEPVHLVNTDPPYNVKVEPRSNNAIAAGLSSFTAERPPQEAPRTLRPKDRPLANDFVSDEEFACLLRAWFGNVTRVLLPGRGFYIWGGFSNCANYPAALEETGLYFSQAIIWVKEHPVLTRKDFMTGHEWCFYGWKLGAAHQFFGPANVCDVWSVKKLHHTEMRHLTEKPVELAVRALTYSSREGEHVLDLFGGSGSTMAAAEQTGRRAFLMELDPLYCDVIVERIAALTGTPAVLEETGETFEAVKARREIE
jgi:DNA modification methylase